MASSALSQPAVKPEARGSRRLFWLLTILVLAWSANYIAAKIAVRGFADAGATRPGVAAVGLRVLISALAFLVLPPFLGSFGKLQRLSWRDLGYLSVLALAAITGNQYCFVVGVAKTSVAHSSLVIALTPIFVLLMAATVGQERITWWKAAGILLAFAGVAELFRSARGGTASIPGDLIVLGATLTFSFYTVASKGAIERFTTFTLNYYVFVIGAIATVPLVWTALRQTPWTRVGWQGWGGVLYMALIGSVIAYLIYYDAMKSMSATQISTLTYLQPIIATILGTLLLPAESITPRVITGGAIILAGVYLVERR